MIDFLINLVCSFIAFAIVGSVFYWLDCRRQVRNKADAKSMLNELRAHRESCDQLREALERAMRPSIRVG